LSVEEKSESKKWEDQTGGKSYIEGLHFSDNHYWTNGTITVTGTKKTSKVDIEVISGGKKLLDESFSIKDDEVRVLHFKVDGRYDVSVKGDVSNAYVFGAGAKVVVDLFYKTDELESVVKKWEDETAVKSYFEGLDLEDDHSWTEGTITVTGKSKSHVCLDVTAGELPLFNESFTIRENETKQFIVKVNARMNVNISGFISNIYLLGAGAKVVLQMHYRD
jgi:hypothetical protein